MLLSNEDIKRCMDSGMIKIQPFKVDQLGEASVDLTLSDEWWFFKKNYKKIFLQDDTYKKVLMRIRNDTITLEPGQVCLGKTIERITLANNIIGMLEGRSRYARVGLSVHITSSLVQPGSSNHQVLEIINFAPFCLVLKKGMRISQIVFCELKTPTSKPYRKFGDVARIQ